MLRSLILTLLLSLAITAPAWSALDAALVKPLAAEESDDKIAAILKLAATAEPDALRVLKAMSQENLFVAGDRLFYKEGEKAFDAVTGKDFSPIPDNPESITINNRVRRELDNALAGLRVFSPDRAIRYTAAKELLGGVDSAMAPLLARAIDKEADTEIRAMLVIAHAQANLQSPDPKLRLAAIRALGDSASPATKALLTPLTQAANEPDETVRGEALVSLRKVESKLAVSENISRVFSGFSLGSILLLAALGLAITYGVMGVINMAHGELIMIGAYATYVIQSLFRAKFPQFVDGYLILAVPVAFLSAALVGMALERLIIRHLYGRPLETLLATWGISLCLIQAVRVIFGPQNVEIANPAWMSGGIEVITNVILPLNRMVIIAFTLGVLGLIWALMNLTRLGLFVRAVTQNRGMAGCVGVPTKQVDTLAFGIGAGLAGLAGCALTQIGNVGPDMGQGYIIDSFLVVVLGGVGQLAGAVWAGLGLGVLSKFLEGWTGAVIAKIIVLTLIIIFIQKRPQGLFALKGRFVEN